jgi:hypothetical protein
VNLVVPPNNFACYFAAALIKILTNNNIIIAAADFAIDKNTYMKLNIIIMIKIVASLLFIKHADGLFESNPRIA